MEDESKKVDKWQDKISSGFDRLVAFASTELDKRRRSTESDTAIVSGVDPTAAATPTGGSSCNTSPDSGIERDAPPTPSSVNGGGHTAPSATPPHLQRQPVVNISSGPRKGGDGRGEGGCAPDASALLSSPGPKMPRLFKSPNLPPTEEECEGFAILLGSPPTLEAGMEYDDREGRVSAGPPRTPSPSNERPPSGPSESVQPPPLTPPYGPDVLDGPYSPVAEGAADEEMSTLPHNGPGLWDDWERPPPLMPTGKQSTSDQQQFKCDNPGNDSTNNGPQYHNDEWSSGDHHFKKKYLCDPWNNSHGDRNCRAKFRPKGKDWDWHGSREAESNSISLSRPSFSSYGGTSEKLAESNGRHQSNEVARGSNANVEQRRPSMLEGDSRAGVHSKLLVMPPPHLEAISSGSHQDGMGHYKGEMSKYAGEHKESVPRPWRMDGNIPQHAGGPGMHIHHGQAPQYPGAVITHQHT